MKNNKLNDKLQEHALTKAIFSLVGYIGDYYIKDSDIVFKIDEEKIKYMDELVFDLPSATDVIKKAKRIYKKFDDSNIGNIIYKFSFINLTEELKINAPDSDICIDHTDFSALTILDADYVKLNGWSVNGNGYININANDITTKRFDCFIDGDICFEAPFITIEDACAISADNINLKGQFIEIKKSSIFTNNLTLDSEFVLTEKARLHASEKIEIFDKNLDEIKEVKSPVVIYNGVDISYSDDIVMPKLRENLIDVLRKVRNKVSTDIKEEINQETIKLEHDLNNKPISKVLKKTK